MDKILEKWDEILQTVKTEHDVSDISFDTGSNLWKFLVLREIPSISLFHLNR